MIPTHNYILVELIPEDSSGLVGVDQDNSQKGKVLDIGEKAEGGLKRGDIVFFQKYAESDLKIEKDGKTLTLIEDKEIRAYATRK